MYDDVLLVHPQMMSMTSSPLYTAEGHNIKYKHISYITWRLEKLIEFFVWSGRAVFLIKDKDRKTLEIHRYWRTELYEIWRSSKRKSGQRLHPSEYFSDDAPEWRFKNASPAGFLLGSVLSPLWRRRYVRFTSLYNDGGYRIYCWGEHRDCLNLRCVG